MTRFQDIRMSVVKKTWMDEGNQKLLLPATPQRLSPWKKGVPGSGVRAGLSIAQIFQPTQNRTYRRGNGNVAPRKRFRGSVPPHPLGVINAAHRIERAAERKQKKLARNG